MNAKPYHRDVTVTTIYVLSHTNLCLCFFYACAFYSYNFLFSFDSWPCILNDDKSSITRLNIFSMAVHVFCNFFLKICPLFGQVLITCLKYSRASFSPSSYSEKIRWGQGCDGAFLRK